MLFRPEIPGFTHSAMPTYFEGDVYFSPRDSRGRSHIYRAAFNPKTGKMGKPRPYLKPGEAGAHDDSGCMVSWLKRDGPRVLCYYVAWNLGVLVPFRNSIGLAINGEQLYGPIKDRDLYDNQGVGSCCDGLRWYLSVLGWERHELALRPRYHIVNGHPHSPAITFKDETEYAIARPCVIHDPDCYRMWYCYRGRRYRIGYAESQDGLQWTRKDGEAPQPICMKGFDDESQCYPFVFDHEHTRYMLYNGDGYGKTGFSLTVIDR